MSAVLQPPGGTVMYQGQLFATPSILRQPPPAHEGDRFVPFAIDWGADTPAGVRSIMIDLTRGGVQPISQIAALWVDNSGSHADVQFLFLSTQTRVVVPAQSSELVPVSTNDVRMVVVAPTSGAGDLTFGQIFNFVPPPVALAETSFSGPTIAGPIAFATGSTVLLPAPASGILTAATITVVGATGGAANGQIGFALADATHQLIFGQFFTRATINYDNLIIFNQTGMDAAFYGGLSFTQNITGTAPTAGNFIVNIYTR